MATVILVRHGRTTANASGTLAGRTPGVELDETGRDQVARTGKRLADVPLVELVTSPLERCRQTAAAVAMHQAEATQAVVEDALTEADYGDWQGGSLAELSQHELWPVVQNQPSAVVFPGGESMVSMQSRAVEAVRRRDAEIEAQHGPHAVWAAVSHGDIIKAVLADALGMHLDAFQRIGVDPASVSIVRYTSARPYVVALNTHAGDLAWLAAKPSGDDAAVGGGAGPAAPVDERS